MKSLRSILILFVIFGMSFSNIPFYALTGLIDSYRKTSGIVDKVWLVEQDNDPDVVDKFVSFRTIVRKLEIQKAQAAITYQTPGAIAYSASAGTSVSPAYPASIAANNLLVLIIGMKPSVANGGSVTTPAGWTAVPSGSLTGAGGYSTTLGADTGNTNVFTYYKVAAGTETGSLAVTIASNGVSWAQMYRYTNASGSWSVAGTTGSDITGNAAVSIAMSANPGVTTGDDILAAMVIPTDVTTPAQFSAEAFTQTGVTFGAVTEISEPDSTTGNDIGGLVARTSVSSGAGSAAPTMTATAAATNTNVRGPGVFIRIREANTAPTLTVSQPDGIGDTVNVGDLYNVTYDLADPDPLHAVTVAMYYDVDAAGLNGIAITGACATAVEGTGATCSWDTTGMTPGNYYVYGLTSDGIAAQVSDYSPGVITINVPASNLTISQTAGSKVSTKNSGAIDQYAHDTACTDAASCSAFTLAASGGTVNVSQIKVTENGTVIANNELSDVNLYYDFDGNWSDAGAETLFGTAATLAADQTATISGTLAINAGQTAYIYVRYDLANGATYPMGGATVNWQIATSADVTSDATESGSGTLAGTQTVLPAADSVTYAVGSDGGRSGDTATISGKGFGAPSLDADQQDCTTATVGSKGCVRFIVGGSDTVEGVDISTWNNTAITFTVSASGLSATYGGTSALEVVAAGQSTATDLAYYIYPNVSGIVDDFDDLTDDAREYDAGDNAANNSTADLKDGEIQINGDHFGSSAGALTILGQTATPAVVGSRCGGSSWTATCITAQVPTTIGDGAGGAGDYTGNVVVTRTGALNDTLPGFRILPRITLLTPNSGPNGQSTTIDGNHLCQPSGTCQSAATFNTTADDGNDVEWGTIDATVTGTPSNTQIIANAPVLADGGYPVTVTTGGGTSYTSNGLTFTIANNSPPTLSISVPPAGNTAIAEGSTYNVTYTLVDTDNIVTAAFYYDTNNDGVGGTAIAGCGTLAEGTNQTCAFNTSVLTPGTAYYVYGVTNDGVNPAVTTVSSGTITVNDAPTLSVSQPPAGNTAVAEGSTYNATYTLTDTDNVVTAVFYYDTNNDGVGGIAIAGCGTMAEGISQTCAFNTSVLTPGTAYYVYGVTSDGVNSSVTTVSSGTITVNDAPTLSVSQPDGVGDTVNVGDLYNITYTLSDPDSIVTSAFYWDTNNDGVGGTAITGACATAAEGSGATCSWNTTGMTAGSYYVYGVTSGDSVNAAVTAVSPGQITINELAQVTADTSGTQAVNLDSGATGQYIGAAFRFRQNSGSADTITALTLSEKNASFTANTGLTSAMIRYETNMAVCTATPTTLTGTLAKSGASFNASDQAVFTSLSSNIPVTVGSNYTCVYLFSNIDSSASGGKQIEMELSASGDFTLQNGTTKAGTYPVALPGTTTIRPNVTGYTNNTEGTITDGAREGNSITINGSGLGGTCDGTNTKVQIGTYTLSCTGATFNNTFITITVDTGLPDTNDGGAGANGLLVTIGGIADNANQTFYAYPTIIGIVDDFADLADDAREYSAGDNAANNSTADLKDGEIQIDGKHFGSSGTVTIYGVIATQAVVGTRCSSSSYSATCITVQVPTGISDSSYVGSIVVERTAGIDSTYSGFRILPRITSLSSANGVVGDNITVNGNHLCQTGVCPGSPFTASNNVLFGATNADAPGTWSWSHTGINAKVPSGSGTVAVKAVSNDYESNTTNFIYVSTAPGAPTVLQQFRSNGVTEIATGGGTNDTPTQAKMEGDFTAETSITAFLEVEVKPKNTAFDGTTNIFTSLPSTGSLFPNMVVSISGLPDGEYHWRARAKNQTTGETSAWVAFGNNPSGDGSTDGTPANVDFAVDTTAPVISSVCVVSPTSSSCDGTTQTDIQAQTRWSTNESATKQVAYQTGACGTGADATAVFNSMTNKEPSSPSGSATAHSVVLSGLTPVTTYYYKIRSSDAFGTISYYPSGATCDSFQTDPAQTRVMKTLEFFIDQNTAVGGTLNKAFDVFLSESKQDRSNIYIKSVIVDIFGTSVGDGLGNISVDTTFNGDNKIYTLSDPGSGVANSWRTTYATSSLNFDCVYCTTHPSNTLNVSITGPTNTSLLGAKAIVTYYYEPL